MGSALVLMEGFNLTIGMIPNLKIRKLFPSSLLDLEETAKDHGVGITMTSKMQSQGFTAPELEEKLPG